MFFFYEKILVVVKTVVLFQSGYLDIEIDVFVSFGRIYMINKLTCYVEIGSFYGPFL